MTSDADPVAEALRVAAVVLTAEGMESLMPGEGVRKHWMQQDATPEAMRQTAAAIAAFLRALPGAVLPDHTGFNVVIPQSDLRAIAAAVERATLEVGHE